MKFIEVHLANVDFYNLPKTRVNSNLIEQCDESDFMIDTEKLQEAFDSIASAIPGKCTRIILTTGKEIFVAESIDYIEEMMNK